MKFGLCAWSFSDAFTRTGSNPDPMTPCGLADLAVSQGMEAVEVAARWFSAADHQTAEAFTAKVAEHRLSVVVDTGGTEVAEELGRVVDATLDTARTLGASAVRTTISRCLEGDRRRFGYEGWKEHLRALVGPFTKVAARAADLGIPIGVENHQDVCSWELAWLCEKVGSPYFGVVMDCGNALAVGEHPAAFASRIMPYLKHVHLKDYMVHSSPSGWRFVRCPLGAGVVDFKDLVARFDAGAPGVLGCIELGATAARHVRLLEEDWWATYDSRPWPDSLAAIRALHAAQQPPGLDWRTPHEQGRNPAELVSYELEQLHESVQYLAELR